MKYYISYRDLTGKIRIAACNACSDMQYYLQDKDIKNTIKEVGMPEPMSTVLGLVITSWILFWFCR